MSSKRQFLGRLLSVVLPALIAATIAATPAATASFSWTPVGSMAVARASFGAALLANGKVLAAGGTGDRRAELFDPATGTFSLTGMMISGRGLATTSLLQSGKVLISGGHDSEIATASAELYDPSSGTFASTGSMSVPRGAHTATLLPDGKVLIAGGHRFNRENSALASAELYDPATGTFAPTGAMAEPRDNAVAALLATGKVLIAGGFTTTSIAVSSAELYDPATGTFSMAGPLASERGNATATPLATGDVLVAGGYTAFPGPALLTAELYDPSSETFSQAGNMSTARGEHSATLLPSGKVLLAGGFTAFPFLGVTLASVDVFDPTAGTFSSSGSLTTARGRHAAVALANGNVLVAGGLTQCCSTNSSAELLSADATPPVITVPADIAVNAINPAGVVVEFTVTATDEDPLNPTVTCTPPSGSVFAIGDTQVECTATDAAGNSASASFIVHVKGAPEQVADLIALVDSYNLRLLGTALHDKLVKVQEFLTANKPKRACEKLDGFLAQVKEQRGKRISVEQADRLTLDARRIKAVIGC